MKKIVFLMLTLMIQSAFADRLFIVSSSLGMFGPDNQINTGMERFGANLVEEALAHRYKKVYRVVMNEYNENNKDEASLKERYYAVKAKMEEVLRETGPNEKIDIFSMQHGPAGSPFDEVPVESLKIPFGKIRNVYSTACNEFGDAIIYPNNKVKITAFNPEFSQSLERIGVENYVYHANMNATGFYTLPLLLNEFSRNTNWKEAAEDAFKKFDQQMATLVPGIQGLRNNQTIQNLIPSFKEDTEGWSDIITSRVVTASRSSMKKSKKSGYTQEIVKMDQSFAKVVLEYCENGLEEMANCDFKDPKLTLSESLRNILKTIKFAFDTYDSGIGSCINGDFLNEAMVIDGKNLNLEIEKLCFKTIGKDKFKLIWKLKKDSLLDFRKQIEIPIDGVRKVSVATRGSILANLKKDKVKMRLRGVKLHMNGFDGEGKLKEITAFRPSGINIYNDGSIEGRVKVLGIPLRAGYNETEALDLGELEMIDFVRLAGFKVQWTDLVNLFNKTEAGVTKAVDKTKTLFQK
jgi:hypothetical protein